MVSMVELVDGSQVLPVYLICDTSNSMNKSIEGVKGGTRRIDVLNDSIRDLFAEIYKGDRTTVKTNVSVISFNTNPFLDFPLADVSSGVTMRPLKAQGLTELAKALDLFNERLLIDEKKRAPRLGYRPVAFVVTDGHPTDTVMEWKDACKRLASRPRPSLAPRIVPCLVGKPYDDQVDTLTASYGKDLSSVSGKILTDGKDIARSIHAVFNSIAKTLNYAAADETLATTRTYEEQVKRMDTVILEALAAPNNQATVTFEEYLTKIM